MKYLIIQLSDSAVSFCHYSAGKTSNLITIDALERGLLWAVKRNLDIQVLYPDFVLPEEYSNLLADYHHVKIMPERTPGGDIIVLDGWDSISAKDTLYTEPVVLQTSYRDFILHCARLGQALYKFKRLNVMFTDVQSFTDSDSTAYEKALLSLSDRILDLYRDGKQIQLNLITDRMMLSGMNNCNAATDGITLAPNGDFYPCPAFYLDNAGSFGNPINGLYIPNGHLYKFEYAPICRICDAYHCKRCVWLNRKLTLEVNTPGHQQCLMAHIERKVAGMLIGRIREFGTFAPEIQIPELDYNDPFEKIVKKNG